MKTQRKPRALMVGSVMFLIAMAWFVIMGRTVEAAPKVTVKKVASVNSLTKSKTIKLAKGKKATLKTTVTVTPNKSANKKVIYKSSNKKVATVTSKGVITGKKPGTAKITVTSVKNKKVKATVTVKVLKGKVTNIALNKTSHTLKTGATVKLTAAVKASAGGSKDIVWTTSNKKVATVNSKGTVKAVGNGNATITAKAADGTGKKAVCKLTVKKAANSQSSIRFAKDMVSTMYPTEELIIRVECSSSKHGKITWKSSNTDVIDFVDDFFNGPKEEEAVIIYAENPGTTTITATVDGKSVSQKIKVVAPKPQYTYEINFLNPPYSYGAFNLVYIKTDNPSSKNFELEFIDVATDKENDPLVAMTDCYYADLKRMGTMTPGFLYKTDGGYLGVFLFLDPGKCRISVTEYLSDAKGNRIHYRSYRDIPPLYQTPITADAGKGYIDIKDMTKEERIWLQSVIDKVTTASMTKKAKMEAITRYLAQNSIYSKTPADGRPGYVTLAADTAIPFWKFPKFEVNSYTSPAILTAFGEMIGYPLENMYGKYPYGTPDWYAWHMIARSVEDGTCYQFCPATDTNVIDTSAIKQLDLSKWKFYTWYK